MAASLHGDTPYPGKTVTSVPVTPYTTSVDVNYDATWLALAGELGWVVLCKDDRIRRRPAELQALGEGKVRLFCLTNAQLTSAEQAEWFLANRHRIIQVSRKPGPYLYGFYGDRIAKLWPR